MVKNNGNIENAPQDGTRTKEVKGEAEAIVTGRATAKYQRSALTLKKRGTWYREEAAHALLQLWRDVMEREPENAPTWRDILRSSELTAKYFGLIQDGANVTHNTLIVNAKDVSALSEHELMSKLDALKRERELSQPTAPTVESNNTLHTPTRDTSHDAHTDDDESDD